jgi:hypothetical protein
MKIFIVAVVGGLNGIALSLAGVTLSDPLWWVVALLVATITTAAVNS